MVGQSVLILLFGSLNTEMHLYDVRFTSLLTEFLSFPSVSVCPSQLSENSFMQIHGRESAVS